MDNILNSKIKQWSNFSYTPLFNTNKILQKDKQQQIDTKFYLQVEPTMLWIVDEFTNYYVQVTSNTSWSIK